MKNSKGYDITNFKRIKLPSNTPTFEEKFAICQEYLGTHICQPEFNAYTQYEELGIYDIKTKEQFINELEELISTHDYGMAQHFKDFRGHKSWSEAKDHLLWQINSDLMECKSALAMVKAKKKPKDVK